MWNRELGLDANISWYWLIVDRSNLICGRCEFVIFVLSGDRQINGYLKGMEYFPWIIARSVCGSVTVTTDEVRDECVTLSLKLPPRPSNSP